MEEFNVDLRSSKRIKHVKIRSFDDLVKVDVKIDQTNTLVVTTWPRDESLNDYLRAFGLDTEEGDEDGKSE